MAALKAGRRIRQVGPRLYVSVPKAEERPAIRAAWSTIVQRLFPRSLISHRTALEFVPTTDGDVFITATTNRRLKYPGLTLHFVRGPGPLDDDPKFLGIRSSSRARAFLENLQATPARVVPIEHLEARLEQILHVEGADELDALRDRAREIANQFDWMPEFRRLDALVGTLLGTRTARVSSAVAIARAAGEPFDTHCLARLQLLFAELRNPLPKLRDTFGAADHYRNKAFFEAYFSNYIEGTKFVVEEAERIVFEKKVPTSRPKDAHDVLGTFEIVSDLGEMRRTPKAFDDFLEVIRNRHARMFAMRAEAEPGMFKSRPNQAGPTLFVHPEYVIGTLRKGWELARELDAGLPRAIFIAFLVSDVHPFVDGNGRLSRIMMNSELAAAELTTIIIPTVFREDYVLAQRSLSQRNRPETVVQALTRAQRFSHLEFSPYPRILKELERRNWFREPDDAKIVD